MADRGPLHWSWLGRLGYAAAWGAQERARDDLLHEPGAPERLLLVEHPPTVTVGRNGDTAGLLLTPAVLAARGIALERATRGGHLTWHAPGQLVAYPILHLRRRGLGPRDHVQRLVEAACGWLAALGVPAGWREDAPGAWVSAGAVARKIASVGVHVVRDVTAHGIAVNLDVDLAGFSVIRPCGLSAEVMTSVARERGASPAVADAAPGLAAAIAAAYGMDAVEDAAP